MLFSVSPTVTAAVKVENMDFEDMAGRRVLNAKKKIIN